MAIADVRNTINPTEQRTGCLLRVFVVENHADTREFLTFMLEELGHKVVVAETMAKALREFPNSGCNVLISDIGLPDGDGWQLMAELRAAGPVYAIAMSGYGMMSDRNRSKAAGYRHHLVKPMGMEQLEAVLKEASDELRGDRRDPTDQASPFLVSASPL